MKYREKTHRISNPSLLGKRLRAARTNKSMSQYRLSQLSGVHRRTIADLEHGLIRNPSPEILALLAGQIGLGIADLYPLAGYIVPKDLPDFNGYMTTKFRGLPPEAIEEIFGHVKYLQAKHGLVPEGPAPGEDEN